MPVPSPAAISRLLTSLVTTTGPLVGPARPPCSYAFPTPTVRPQTHEALEEELPHLHVPQGCAHHHSLALCPGVRRLARRSYTNLCVSHIDARCRRKQARRPNCYAERRPH
jgi:hypothetical protein